VRPLFPDNDRLKLNGVNGVSSGQEFTSHAANSTHETLEASTRPINYSQISSVIYNIFNGAGSAQSRRGKLIGCRQQPSDRSTSNRSVSNLSITSALPDCPASNILRSHFMRSREFTIIEEWVDSILGDEGRLQCFGRTAISRAMRQLQVFHVDDERLPSHGELRVVDGWLVAFISKSQSRSREMFTIAHELGHAALYVLSPGLDQSAAKTEKLCNMFAGELMMPTGLVHDIWRSMPDVETVVELERKTGCSLSAACVRVAEYLGNATTGIASPSGVIKQQYGIDLGRDLRSSLGFAAGKAAEGKYTSDFANGLNLSCQKGGKGDIAFLSRRFG
jgi:IrrE N-terminal-like domain